MAHMRRLCSTVLIMEAIVIGLAIPVAITVEHARAGLAGAAGGGLALAAVLLAGVVGRRGAASSGQRLSGQRRLGQRRLGQRRLGQRRLGQNWPLVAGSVLQALVIAAGTMVPAMYVLGVIFGALWATAIWLGYQAEGVVTR
jgi:hypothetical protein